ncbi:uncharacterized protein VDAG_04495 [Verticillium dahliae VdLs.17]|uniref:Uncharacterized protein n=1 Tax=Verticillium dahliae (strain VdLs.17 / ATCC MYA-4575 / FGSC 10137) TaxID=498257 RepID=G2X2H1_VERDV|nr:uncharacterized protein VDAG_04495 [Verticillium dahliae VdLs.17]EGY23057.1 hypothetical protein VDAG_04495 [Verticillium dahliae VdLs.17]
MPSAAAGEVSHGRGGAGNIHADQTKYVDGAVVRTGPEGSHNDGAYSVGRGGAGNIGDVGAKTPVEGRADKDVVPTEAYRQSGEGSDFHTGRGGAGNAYEASSARNDADIDGKAASAADRASGGPVGLADKLKNKLSTPLATLSSSQACRDDLRNDKKRVQPSSS